MRSWPPNKTPNEARKLLQTRHWAFALSAAFAIVPLCGLLLAIAIGLLLGGIRSVFAALPMLYLVVVLSLPPLLLGGVILEVALRLGHGGWAIALLTGALVALVYFRLLLGISPRNMFHGILIAVLGLPYAGVFWLTLRNQVPKAFTR